MQQYQQCLKITTQGKNFTRITVPVADIVRESGIEMGICHLVSVQGGSGS
jgi:thiamine phosphate synthase YjbQ (UPF0047 family)